MCGIDGAVLPAGELDDFTVALNAPGVGRATKGRRMEAIASRLASTPKGLANLSMHGNHGCFTSAADRLCGLRSTAVQVVAAALREASERVTKRISNAVRKSPKGGKAPVCLVDCLHANYDDEQVLLLMCECCLGWFHGGCPGVQHVIGPAVQQPIVAAARDTLGGHWGGGVEVSHAFVCDECIQQAGVLPQDYVVLEGGAAPDPLSSNIGIAHEQFAYRVFRGGGRVLGLQRMGCRRD